MASALIGLAKRFGLLLFCLTWLALGLFGHDPWKPDEAYTFGLVHHVLETGDWVVPTLAGEPFLERPPLFTVTAAIFADLARAWLPLYDGARLASAFYVGLTLLFLLLAGRELYGPKIGALPVLLLIGCLGFLVRSHLLSADNALLCGMALGIYGLALAPRLALAGGIALGCGIGIAFLGRGWLGPLFLLLTALLLPLFQTWRNLGYLRALGVALVALAPWVAIWPMALYSRDSALFDEWLQIQGPAFLMDFLRPGPDSDFFFYLKTLPWFAWPALPVALWTLWAGSRGLNGGLAKPGIQLPLLCFSIMLAVLSIAADARELLALPLLLPLSLLAASGVDSLRRGSSAALDWFGILTFGLLALALWLAWAVLLTGAPASLASQLHKIHPGFATRFDALAFGLSAVFTLLWFALVRPARRSNQRAVLNWAAGITLVWGIAMTLWLPYIDYDKSYRGMMLDLKRALGQEHGCVASQNLAEAQRALLDFFVGLKTERAERGAENQCDLLLVQGDASSVPPEGPWQEVWRGTRPDDEREVMRLYRYTEQRR